MKGLIYKDFCSIKKTVGLLGLYACICATWLFREGGAEWAAVLFMTWTCAAGLGFFNVDEAGHSGVYIRALPVSVREIVAARYLAQLSLAAIGLAVGLAAVLVAGTDVTPVLLSALSIVTVTVGIATPLMFRFGAFKGRMTMLAVVAGAVAAGVAVLNGAMPGEGTQLAAMEALLEENRAAALAAATALCLAVLAGSWAVSCRVVRGKKDGF